MREKNITKIFWSKCRKKILEKFFLEYESWNNEGFHMRLLSRDLNEQINSIKRELDNLSDLWILKHKTQLRKKIFFINSNYFLLDEFISIFLKSYNPIKKVKQYFKPLLELELIIINESLSNKLVKNTKNLLDIFLIWEIDKTHFQDFLTKTFYGRNVKYAIISTENFYKRIEYWDKLISNILSEKGNLYLKDNMKIKEKLWD